MDKIQTFLPVFLFSLASLYSFPSGEAIGAFGVSNYNVFCRIDKISPGRIFCRDWFYVHQYLGL
jgi:hypothetical protein